MDPGVSLSPSGSSGSGSSNTGLDGTNNGNAQQQQQPANNSSSATNSCNSGTQQQGAGEGPGGAPAGGGVSFTPANTGMCAPPGFDASATAGWPGFQTPGNPLLAMALGGFGMPPLPVGI